MRSLVVLVLFSFVLPCMAIDDEPHYQIKFNRWLEQWTSADPDLADLDQALVKDRFEMLYTIGRYIIDPEFAGTYLLIREQDESQFREAVIDLENVFPENVRVLSLTQFLLEIASESNIVIHRQLSLSQSGHNMAAVKLALSTWLFARFQSLDTTVVTIPLEALYLRRRASSEFNLIMRHLFMMMNEMDVTNVRIVLSAETPTWRFIWKNKELRDAFQDLNSAHALTVIDAERFAVTKDCQSLLSWAN